MLRYIIAAIVVLILLGLLIQLVPYGRDHSNPPVKAEPQWDSPETRALAKRACFDCHSNETVWPWYSNIAPVSWLLYRDVTQGRERINFSEWNRAKEQDVEEFREVHEERSMPPAIYLPLHPDARLTRDEYDRLFTGLEMIAASYHR